MNAGIAEKLADAFGIDDGVASVRRVKDLVRETLCTADPAARVVVTEYFNHTYIPDLVVEWPTAGAQAHREIYLRSTQDPGRLVVDVRDHADASPVFVHLSALDSDPDQITTATGELTALATAARSAQSLVTDAISFEELTTHSRAPGAALFPSSVLRGGRGLLEPDDARHTARLVSDGFAGAMVSDPESTAAALATIEDLLTGTQAAEVSAVLETLWIAGGGAPQLFPRRLGDGGASLSPDRLKLLIEQIPGDFTEFWHRVGTNVGIETFAGLTLRGTQPALQQIMHTALPNLAVRTCRIVHSDRHARTQVRWQVGDGQLYLSGTDREAWLGQKNDDLPRADETASTARPSPQQLLDRFERARLPIVSVQMMRAGRALSLADGHTDIRAEIVPLAATLGEGYVVNRAGTLLEDTKPVTADFVTGTVFGGSVARLSASALLHAAWSVLVDLEEAYRAQIDAAIGRPSPVSWLAVDTSFLLDPVPVAVRDDDLLSDWDTALFTYDPQSLIRRTRRWVSATPLDAEELARVGAVLEQRGELGKAETWYWRAAGAGSRTGRDAARRLLQRWRRIDRVDEAFGTGQIAPAWAEAYAALLNFMAREGHSRVPREHRENAVKLGEWVHQQRRFRDLLTAELETQLEVVPGWTWETNTRDRR